MINSLMIGALMTLPINPLTGVSGPWSLDYLAVANHIVRTGSIVPYSPEYVQSLGINPDHPKA